MPTAGGFCNSEETIPEQLESGAHVPAELPSAAASSSSLPRCYQTKDAASQHSGEAGAQSALPDDSLAVGSVANAEATCDSPTVAVEQAGSSSSIKRALIESEEATVESPEERKARLLSRPRSHPTQLKHSKKLDIDPQPAFKCTRIDQNNIDLLSDLAPCASLYFDIESLKSRHTNISGTRSNWIEHMNDRNTHARHRLIDAMRKKWCGWRGGWRLLNDLSSYSEPWKRLHWDDLRVEYPDSRDPFADYIKHFLRCYEGEVALAWDDFRNWSPKPLPRDQVLGDPQFSRNKQNAHALAKLPRSSDTEFDDTVDLLAVGNTMILRKNRHGQGHLHISGGAITSGELLLKFGDKLTVYELMFWYHNATKLAKKRPHAWGSQECREAAQARKKVRGRYGHFT